MSATAVLMKRTGLRGLDTNSLLRMLDVARAVQFGGGTAMERERGERSYHRVVDELCRRGEYVRK